MLSGSIITTTFRGLLSVILPLTSYAAHAHAQLVTSSNYFQSIPTSGSTVRSGAQATVKVRFVYFDTQNNIWKPLARQTVSFQEKYSGYNWFYNYDFREVARVTTDSSGFAIVTRRLVLPREEKRGGEYRYRCLFPGNQSFKASWSLSPNIWIAVKP